MLHFQLCVLLLVMAFGTGSSVLPLPFKKFHVRIVNNLRDRNLNLRCKSSDNDLGYHILLPNKEYEFSFRMNYIGTTLFWCNLWHGNSYASFDVFKPDYDFFYNGCGGGDSCMWRANIHGIYLLRSDHNTWNAMYRWAKV
ncbi:hypothetical protein Tsubulata_002875 [Turnera subulata]|uniref:S-protein homolog n=1 Tax=Turnera subulata TaxID=218843 RepID=A0A9Q0FC03_9ROSI|nr:hypothetical protein Tsubulata_002875 [Turnera subulata]